MPMLDGPREIGNDNKWEATLTASVDATAAAAAPPRREAGLIRRGSDKSRNAVCDAFKLGVP